MILLKNEGSPIFYSCPSRTAIVPNEFQAGPVIPVEDAVRVELEAMAWRDGLKRK